MQGIKAHDALNPAKSVRTEDYLSVSVVVLGILAVVVGCICDTGEASPGQKEKTPFYIRAFSLLLATG